jgi:glycosyltransferase involved in cell wall biosynthesis
MREDSKADKILIVADCKIENEFTETLATSLHCNPQIYYFDATVAKQWKKCARHFIYFSLAFKTFKHKKDYKYIIFWQQFIGIYFAFLLTIFGKRDFKGICIVLHFIYKARNSFIGCFHKYLFMCALDVSSIRGVICHSEKEKEFYVKEFGCKYQYKIFYVKYGIKAPEDNFYFGRTGDKKERYFFSGGTSNRDYRTLIDGFRGLDERLIIACLRQDIKRIDIPKNVTVLHDIFGMKFIKYLVNSYAVTVILDNPNISSGHLVLLQAMSLGKAIIATRGICVENYLDDNCAVLVKDHSAKEIKEAVKDLLNNEHKSLKLGNWSRLKFESEFTLRKYGGGIAGLLCGMNGN